MDKSLFETNEKPIIKIITSHSPQRSQHIDSEVRLLFLFMPINN